MYTCLSTSVCDGDAVYVLEGSFYPYDISHNNISKINVTDGSLIEEIVTDLDITKYVGFLGSAINPINGELFVVLQLKSAPKGVLATMTITDDEMIEITEIGDLGDLFFVSITFDCMGTLYGITYDVLLNKTDLSEQNQSAIYIINTETADTEFVLSRNDAECDTDDVWDRYGETLSFDYDNLLLYRTSGNAIINKHDCFRYESININDDIINQINLTDTRIGKYNDIIHTMEYVGKDTFLAISYERYVVWKLFTITTAGIIESRPIYISWGIITGFPTGTIPTINVNEVDEICLPSPFCNITSGPTTSEPTTFEPTTSEPTTFEPTTSEPTTFEPTTSEPTTFEPTTSEPITTSETTTSEISSTNLIAECFIGSKCKNTNECCPNNIDENLFGIRCKARKKKINKSSNKKKGNKQGKKKFCCIDKGFLCSMDNECCADKKGKERICLNGICQNNAKNKYSSSESNDNALVSDKQNDGSPKSEPVQTVNTNTLYAVIGILILFILLVFILFCIWIKSNVTKSSKTKIETENQSKLEDELQLIT